MSSYRTVETHRKVAVGEGVVTKFCFGLFQVFERRSHYVAWAGLELILLPPPSAFWDESCGSLNSLIIFPSLLWCGPWSVVLYRWQAATLDVYL